MKTRSTVRKSCRKFGNELTDELNCENSSLRSNKERQHFRKTKALATQREPILEYMQDIMTFCNTMEEAADQPVSGKETEITNQVRAILMSWIIQVHEKFQFRYQTLFLTIRLIDSYSKLVSVRKSDYQLLGLTCLFIAGKYEQIYTPKIKKIITVCDRLFSVDDVLKTEGSIINALNFHISQPTVNWFLNAYLFVLDHSGIKFQKNFITNCQYVMELCLLQYKVQEYEPSIQSLSVMHVTSMMEKFLHISIASLLQKLSGKDLKKVKDCCKMIDKVFRERNEGRYKAVNKKY